MKRRLLLAPAVLLLAGCGMTVGVPGPISGTEVGVEAEKVYEKQPGVAPGTMTCGSLRDHAGDVTRCTRVGDTDGTLVKLGLTVTLLQPGRPRKLGVQADKQAEEFGLSGDVIEKSLAQQYAATYGTEPDEVSCPYLKGEVGNQVVCKLTIAGEMSDVAVTVDRVDPSTYATHYVFGQLPPG